MCYAIQVEIQSISLSLSLLHKSISVLWRDACCQWVKLKIKVIVILDTGASCSVADPRFLADFDTHGHRYRAQMQDQVRGIRGVSGHDMTLGAAGILSLLHPSLGTQHCVVHPTPRPLPYGAEILLGSWAHLLATTGRSTSTKLTIWTFPAHARSSYDAALRDQTTSTRT